MAKRGRKPKKERKGYFYEVEEQAVVDYLNTDDVEEKNRIYNSILKPAFTKMVESIIRTFHMYIPDEEFEMTFNDTLSFLMTKIDHFDPKKNYKAFSYCGTICKNYLLHKRDSYSKKIVRTTPYDEVYEEISNNIKYVDDSDSGDLVSVLIKKSIEEIKKIMGSDNISLTDNEIAVGNSLIFLLENWEDLLPSEGSNKFNKSSILYFLRENTFLSTKEVRDSMKKYRKAYYDMKKEIIKNEL